MMNNKFQILFYFFFLCVLALSYQLNEEITFHNRIEKGGYVLPIHERIETNISLPLPPGMNLTTFESYFEDCEKGCYGDLNIIYPQSAISLDNKTSTNNMRCASMSGLINCLVMNENKGFSSPGIVGCPNYCSEITADNPLVDPKGTCYEAGTKNKCICSSGFTGEDCSQVSCGDNKCTGRGTCNTIHKSVDVCECKPGFSLNDCSGKTVSPPPIVSSLPSHQYSSYDKYGNNHPVFNESTIAQIYINMPAENLTYYLDPENSDTKTYSEAEFIFYNGIVSEKLSNVGIRIKGGISRHFFKKTWKISFNTFEKGRKFYQLKKLVLKGTSFDPSFLREKISSDLYYSMDTKIERISFAMLYINGVNFGLQVMLEPVDGQFIKTRFEIDDEEGPLYKCVGELRYLGSNPAIYSLLNDTLYKPENDNSYNYTLFANFVTILNTKANDSDYSDQLEAVCDVESIVRIYVASIASGQTDGLLNMNNFFIYFDPSNDDRATFIRHDLDLSFGIFDYPLYRMDIRNIYEWYFSHELFEPRGNHFLSLIFSVPKYQDMLTNYMHIFVNKYFKNDSNYAERILAFHDLIQAAAPLDLWHPQDFGWSFDDFKYSLKRPVVVDTLYPLNYYLGNYTITNGILDFLEVRHESILEQLKPFVPN